MVASLCRGGVGSFPQLLDIQGPSRTLKEQPQGVAPVQKISVCAEILRLHRIKLCLLIAPLWGVSEEGGHVHITTVHIFGIMCWRAGRPCPHSPLWPCRFRASMAQGRGWHRWGCARLTLLSQPPPRSACSVQ